MPPLACGEAPQSPQKTSRNSTDCLCSGTTQTSASIQLQYSVQCTKRTKFWGIRPDGSGMTKRARVREREQRNRRVPRRLVSRRRPRLHRRRAARRRSHRLHVGRRLFSRAVALSRVLPRRRLQVLTVTMAGSAQVLVFDSGVNRSPPDPDAAVLQDRGLQAMTAILAVTVLLRATVTATATVVRILLQLLRRRQLSLPG